MFERFYFFEEIVVVFNLLSQFRHFKVYSISNIIFMLWTVNCHACIGVVVCLPHLNVSQFGVEIYALSY